MESLLEAEVAGRRLKYVLFWGHTPPQAGGVGPHVLSQWYPHRFEADGVGYPSAEHYMMARKARLFGDVERLGAILDAVSPREAKALGRTVRGFDERVWSAHCFDIVTRGSVAKFASDADLRSYLVGTGTRVLVEASPQDRIWGIGLSAADPDAQRPSAWQGTNLLGFALMAARAELRGPGTGA